MQFKKTASLVLFFFLLCIILFPDVQGWWLRRSRRSRSTSKHRHAWQRGRPKPNHSYKGMVNKFGDNEELRYDCPKFLISPRPTNWWLSYWYQPKIKIIKRSISRIESHHEYYYEDRVWRFACRANFNMKMPLNCSWSGYVNTYDGPFTYICPNNGYITGMRASAFSGHFKDRKFRFECCDGTRLRFLCMWTSYVNHWDASMDYEVPLGYNLAGAFSYHNDRYEDRRWKFYICQ